MSPEICNGDKYNFKSDIWMIGCVLYELTCLKKPFHGDNFQSLIYNILHTEILPIPKLYSEELRRLINLFLKKDPNLRPSLDEILEDENIKKKMKFDAGIFFELSPIQKDTAFDFSDSNLDNLKYKEHVNENTLFIDFDNDSIDENYFLDFNNDRKNSINSFQGIKTVFNRKDSDEISPKSVNCCNIRTGYGSTIFTPAVKGDKFNELYLNDELLLLKKHQISTPQISTKDILPLANEFNLDNISPKSHNNANKISTEHHISLEDSKIYFKF